MAKLKTAIGFHMGVPNHANGIGAYWRKLMSNGHAIIAKGVNNAGPVYEVQQLAKQYPGVPAYGIWRQDQFPHGGDVPHYGANPADEAFYYWQHIEKTFPPELDKDFAYVEFPNEADKNRADWLGQFAYECGIEALRRGYKYLCPAWSGGEPEPEDWESNGWLAYFHLCAQNPDRLGVSVHEYTFQSDVTMLSTSPWLIGRVSFLNDVCDRYNVARPWTFITEWGYGATNAPPHSFGVPDMITTVDTYIRQTPNVKGVVIWALDSGSNWGGIHKTIQPYIEPMGNHILATDWPEPYEPPIDPPDPPMDKIKFVEYIYPQEADEILYGQIVIEAWEDYKRTVGGSVDHAIAALQSETASDASYAVVWEPYYPSQQAAIQKLMDANIAHVLRYVDTEIPTNLFKYRPCDTDSVSQSFGARPDYYAAFGLPGHEGIDYRVGWGHPYYAVQDGVVVYASDRSPSGGISSYGWHCYIRHEVDGYIFHTCYAHASHPLPVVEGQQVKAGDIVGYSGNTGASDGYHLHFNLMWPSDTGNGYPMYTYGQCVDPWPNLDGKDAPPQLPSEVRYDILPYIRGDGRLYEVANAYGGQERFQTQRHGGEFWQTKNHLAEQLFWDNYYIYRGWDTSPGNNRYYQQQEPKGTTRARWLPRFVAEGEDFSVGLWVQFYNWNCSQSALNTGQVYDTRRIVKRHDTWTSRAGITLQDVFQVDWVNGGEKYFYARNYGLVGWERMHQDPNTPQWSAISEIHAPGARPDNNVQLPSCLV